MKKFVLVPLGSAGDINPLVWLGRLMAGRGHEVTMVVQAGMADHAWRAGLHTVPVGNSDQQQAIASNPDLWHPRKAFPLLAKHFPEWAREAVEPIRAQIDPGRTVLVGAGIGFGARIVSELEGVPLVTTHLQPAIFMSPMDCPVLIGGMERLKKRALWMRRFFFWLGFLETDRLLRRRINRIRKGFGLEEPVRNIMREWAVSPDLILALFPEWFGKPQADWPRQTVTTRFPLYDESEARPVKPELEAFLRAGEPPILLTPGSANMSGRKFLFAASEACWSLRRRCLIITPFRDQLPPTLPAGAAHFEHAPFSQVFPRCAAVVHHGGIGTTAQGLSAGVPQLLMPMAHDQPDNAWRVRQLGTGDYLYPAQFHPEAIARRLQMLTGSELVAQMCREARDRVRAQMPPERVAKILEEFAVSRCRA